MHALTSFPFPCPCSQLEHFLPLHSQLSSILLPVKGQARQFGSQWPITTSSAPQHQQGPLHTHPGLWQAHPSAAPYAVLPPARSALPSLSSCLFLCSRGEGWLSRLPSSLNQSAQVVPSQRARSTPQPWAA